MPRTVTSLTVQTPDSETLRERLDAFADEHDVDWRERSPGTSAEGHLWFDFRGDLETELRDAVTEERIAPLEWAVVSVGSDVPDEGVDAWVYDGTECVDEFRGDHRLDGADTVAYLERYHGVDVEVPGPYEPSGGYRPSLALARPETVPDRTLADESPTGPFTVEDATDWLVVEGQVGTDHAFAEGFDVEADFVGWLRERLRAAGLVLEPNDRLVDRPWVTEGPTDLVREPPSETVPGRVRVRVPLTGVAVDAAGRLSLPSVDLGDYPGGIDWLVVCHGSHPRPIVATVFLGDSAGLTDAESLDRYVSDTRHGADVAAYLRRYYGWRIDPTPAEIETPPETDDLPEAASRPSDRVARRLRDAGVEPGPEMPAPDE